MKRCIKKVFKCIFRFCIKYPFVFFVISGTLFSLDHYSKIEPKDYIWFVVTVVSFVIGVTLFNFHINFLDKWIKELLKDTKYYRKLIKEYREDIKELQDKNSK